MLQGVVTHFIIYIIYMLRNGDLDRRNMNEVAPVCGCRIFCIKNSMY